MDCKIPDPFRGSVQGLVPTALVFKRRRPADSGKSPTVLGKEEDGGCRWGIVTALGWRLLKLYYFLKIEVGVFDSDFVKTLKDNVVVFAIRQRGGVGRPTKSGELRSSACWHPGRAFWKSLGVRPHPSWEELYISLRPVLLTVNPTVLAFYGKAWEVRMIKIGVDGS